MAHRLAIIPLMARVIPAVLALTAWACTSPAPTAALPASTRLAVNTETPLVATVVKPSSVPSTATLLPNTSEPPDPSPTRLPLPPTATDLPSAAEMATATNLATATVPSLVRFMAMGDLMLGRGVGERIQLFGPDVVFSGVASALRQADLIAANLECVISDQGQPESKGYTFRAPVAAIKTLSQGSINVVSLANNHSLDYGLDGLADMLTRLREGGIRVAGAGADAETAQSPVILKRNGVRVAFLAYVNVPVEGRTAFDTRSWAAGVEKPGVAWGEPDGIAKDVASAKTLADVVVVMLHSGLEGRADVNPVQQALAHAAVDAGAALVLGSHSHTLQPVEHYKDGLIAYSLGNFVFDGFLPPSNFTAIFSAELSPGGVDSYTWIPVVIENGLPRLAAAAEAAQILPLVQEQ